MACGKLQYLHLDHVHVDDLNGSKVCSHFLSLDKQEGNDRIPEGKHLRMVSVGY